MTFADGEGSVTVPDDWRQGRTLYGGLTAAVCLEAALRVVDAPPPLRSAQVSFIGPASGPIKVRAEVLRQGKSALFVGADLYGEKGLAGRAVFTFGAGRESQFDLNLVAAPDVPSYDQSEDFFHGGVGPAFTQHFEPRLAKGARPITGSSEYDHYIWVRHRNETPPSSTALLALADMPPPAMLPMFTEFKPISSINWHLNFLVDAPTTTDGWWLMQSCAEHAVDGYSSQNMYVWNTDGVAVIAGRQSVVIFA